MLGVADLARDVLHERTASRDVEHLDAAADREHGHVRFERARDQLQLVLVASGFGGGERLVRMLAVYRRQHVAAAGEQKPVEIPHHVSRRDPGRVENDRLASGTPDRLLVIVSLAGRRDCNLGHIEAITF